MLIKGPISLEEIPPWLSLKINRRIFTYENTGNGYVKVHEIYRIADDWPVKSNFVGVFSPASGLIFTKKIIWDRRKDLDGYLIHCATESVGQEYFNNFPKIFCFVFRMLRSLIGTRKNLVKQLAFCLKFGKSRPKGTVSRKNDCTYGVEYHKCFLIIL